MDIVSKWKTKSLDELIEFMQKADEYYYIKGRSLMLDTEYDELKEYMLTFPSITKENIDNIIGHRHCKVITKNKVKLPYEMWSMNKIKPNTGELDKWKNKYKRDCVLSCKLDGISGLYTTEGDKPKLYTRGNGVIGQDISYFIPYMNLHMESGYTVRGEFVIRRDTFKDKYANEFSNSRNFVAGLLNQKTITKSLIRKLNDIHFIGYEIIEPEMRPSEQMILLSTNLYKSKMMNVKYKCIYREELTEHYLSTIYTIWKQTYEYDIDGIVCIDDKIHPRPKGCNPEYAFAFKMALKEQKTEAIVKEVIWTPSKDGYLKPRIRIEPVNINGVNIEYASAFNARFIKENNIGVGTIIELIRSGDVIPHIYSIIKKSEKPCMPSIPYQWTKSGVDICMSDYEKQKNDIVNIKQITLFLKQIGVEGISEKGVQRLYNAGYNSISKLIKIDVNGDDIENIKKIDGFHDKSSRKFVEQLNECIKKASLLDLTYASGIFGRGFGLKRLEIILKKYPDIFVTEIEYNILEFKLSMINGMSTKTIEPFIENRLLFIKWMKEVGLEDKLYIKNKNNIDDDINKEKENEISTHKLFKKKYVLSGFRDKTFQSKLEYYDMKEMTNVTKETYVLIVKDKTKETTKIATAKKLNVPIYTIVEFMETYKI